MTSIFISVWWVKTLKLHFFFDGVQVSFTDSKVYQTVSGEDQNEPTIMSM
jgi:hypothetical protein